MLKIIKKDKKGIRFRAGPTWMRRGTRGHVAAPRGPIRAHAGPRSVYITYIIYLFHIVSIMGFQPSVDRKGIQPINPSGVINSTGLLIFFCVGLSPTQLSSFQAMWLTEERRSGGAQKIRALIAWTRTTDQSIAQVPFEDEL